MSTLILFFGCGLDAISSSLFDNLSVLASLTGPNTVVRSLTLFAFLVVERSPLAMLDDAMRNVEIVSSMFPGCGSPGLTADSM